MEERWAEIDGFDGLYLISSCGRVFKRGYGVLKAQCKNSNGYIRTDFSHKGKRYRFTIHRLVAKYFVENPMCKPTVNHIDGDKCNNNAENLEWCTVEENQLHAFKNKLSAKMPISVLQYSKDGDFLREWESVRQASLSGFGNITSIINCCKGRYKSSGGYIWKFKDEDKLVYVDRTFKIRKDLIDKLDEIAYNEGKSLNFIVSKMLKESIKNFK